MQTALVVDAVCDLPPDYCRSQSLFTLPVTLLTEQDQFDDTREQDFTRVFYEQFLEASDIPLGSAAWDSHRIGAWLLHHCVTQADRVVMLTVSQRYSELFANAKQAAQTVRSNYREIRQAAGLNTPFLIEVVDSQTLFAGQGLLAFAANQLIQQSRQLAQVIRQLEELRQYVETFLLVEDVRFLQERARSRGEIGLKSGWGLMGGLFSSYPVQRLYREEVATAFKTSRYEESLNQLLTQAARAIDKGLRIPAITVSYGGELVALAQHPPFAALMEYASQRQIALLVAPMSACAGIYVGPRAVSLAYAAR